MFYISSVDGEILNYQPVEFRSRRAVELAERVTPVGIDLDDAVVLESSLPQDATAVAISYTRPRGAESSISVAREFQSNGEDIPAIDSDVDPELLDISEIALEVMSSPVKTLGPNDSLAQAAEVFREYRYRYVPVVAEDSTLVGLISDRDLIRSAELSENPSSQTLPVSIVSDVMARTVLHARPQAEIAAISQVLFRERIGVMPIVEKNGKLAGMVTRSDILRALVGVTASSGARRS